MRYIRRPYLFHCFNLFLKRFLFYIYPAEGSSLEVNFYSELQQDAESLNTRYDNVPSRALSKSAVSVDVGFLFLFRFQLSKDYTAVSVQGLTKPSVLIA